MGVGQEDQVTGSFRRLSDRNAPKPIPLLAVMVLMVVTVVVLIELIIMGVTSVAMESKKNRRSGDSGLSAAGWLDPKVEAQPDQLTRARPTKQSEGKAESLKWKSLECQRWYVWYSGRRTAIYITL